MRAHIQGVVSCGTAEILRGHDAIRELTNKWFIFKKMIGNILENLIIDKTINCRTQIIKNRSSHLDGKELRKRTLHYNVICI